LSDGGERARTHIFISVEWDINQKLKIKYIFKQEMSFNLPPPLITFCEKKYEYSPNIAEFFNFITSFAFLATAFFVKSDNLSLNLLCLALSSALFHAIPNLFSEVLDETFCLVVVSKLVHMKGGADYLHITIPILFCISFVGGLTEGGVEYFYCFALVMIFEMARFFLQVRKLRNGTNVETVITFVMILLASIGWSAEHFYGFCDWHQNWHIWSATAIWFAERC
jgi:hypothetical protein